MSELNVNILSPAKVVSRTKSEHVQLPGSLGYLGILPGHTRFLSELGVGQLTVHSSSGPVVYFVSGGYVDVNQDVVTVLADVIEKRSDIDVARAEKAKARALARLAKPTADLDVERAMASLGRANQRLATAGKAN
jgi:F-type H+-transporting ATPase subunit epsilon